LEESSPAKMCGQKWLYSPGEKWRKDKNSPQPVNHAGNRRKRYHAERKHAAQRSRTHLGGKRRQADGKRDRHHQRKQRRHQRAVNKWQRAKIAVHRVPITLEEKGESKLVQRQQRTLDQLEQDQRHDSQQG